MIYLPDIVGGGYGNFWRFKGRYRVVKGSRASKKSKTTALNMIVRLMQYPKANILVVRKVYRTLKDSCFAELKWAVSRLNVEKIFRFTVSPLEITCTLTGQKIFFRGLDDPMKITSITVSKGYLCWLWLEEAYEIESEADFDMLAESIRGDTGGIFKQITLTLNPWNENHWIKKRFFDTESDDIFAVTTNYKINEWLDDADRKMFEDMRINNPRRYLTAGLGEWGIADGLVYEMWDIEDFNYRQIAVKENTVPVFGLDFGYVNDETAFFCGIADNENMKLYVFDEIYEKSLTNTMIYERIAGKGYGKEIIYADCAEPKSIDELYRLGLKGIRATSKGKDSILSGIQFVHNYRIKVSPNCKNFINEISNYSWAKDKFGNSTNKPLDKNNHLLDAMRYSLDAIRKGSMFSFRD